MKQRAGLHKVRKCHGEVESLSKDACEHRLCHRTCGVRCIPWLHMQEDHSSKHEKRSRLVTNVFSPLMS